MSSGFFALLDDIAALAKLAAASIDDIGTAAGKATVKAAGVVVEAGVRAAAVRGCSIFPSARIFISRNIAVASIPCAIQINGGNQKAARKSNWAFITTAPKPRATVN